jgi:hypothetical protein
VSRGFAGLPVIQELGEPVWEWIDLRPSVSASPRTKGGAEAGLGRSGTPLNSDR